MANGSLISRRRIFLCVCCVVPVVLYSMAQYTRWLHNTPTEVVTQPFVLSTTQNTSSTLKVMNWETSADDRLFTRSHDRTTYNLTMVSAYFDLGTFLKGFKKNVREKSDYEDWFRKFGALHTPLVFYTDSDTFAQLALHVRGGELSALTRVIKVPRDQLWSFQLRDKVARIYAQSSYPKHLPNTVIPEYSCAMHAKFEVMNNTIRNRYFPSTHYAWIDVGCFRDLRVKRKEVLSLVPPQDLNPRLVMYSEVNSPALTMLPSQIFRRNIVWVGGASFVGRAGVVLKFTEQYRRATVRFLEEKELSNSDQQVIYSMFTNEGRNLVKPTVELQLIRQGWFGVGYHCLKRTKLHIMLYETSTPKVWNWEASADDTVYTGGSHDQTTYNLTIISAYFDLGSFPKGSSNNVRGKSHYEDWFRKFGALHTPFVFYTDSDTFAQLALHVRGGELSALTRVIKVPRDQLWSFQLRDKVARIYAQSSYPKHLPNTVIPEYSCAMHAKFEVMNNTIRNRYFPSTHYAWIDVGCFRDLDIKNNQTFTLVPPQDLNPRLVMYSEVFSPALSMLPSKIFRENIVWVGGASFVGRAGAVLEFTEQYKRATVRFLEEKELSNSDQQVIYSMFTNEGRNLVKPTVELQLIRQGWFGVGYHCLKKEEQ